MLKIKEIKKDEVTDDFVAIQSAITPDFVNAIFENAGANYYVNNQKLVVNKSNEYLKYSCDLLMGEPNEFNDSNFILVLKPFGCKTWERERYLLVS